MRGGVPLGQAAVLEEGVDLRRAFRLMLAALGVGNSKVSEDVPTARVNVNGFGVDLRLCAHISRFRAGPIHSSGFS